MQSWHSFLSANEDAFRTARKGFAFKRREEKCEARM